MNKKKGKTKMVSVRIDSDLYEVVKSKNLNLSFTLNTLLRAYLYIQKRDLELPIIGSSGYNPKDLVIDMYHREFIMLD